MLLVLYSCKFCVVCKLREAEVLPSFVLLHEMLLATSARISQAATVRTIRETSKFQLPTPPSTVLNPSLVVTLRYTVPIMFLINELHQGKGNISQRDFRELSRKFSSRFGRHPDLLLTFNYNFYCLQATNIFFLISRIASFSYMPFYYNSGVKQGRWLHL